MQINNPVAAPTFDVETTPVVVFNALPPNVFTDLNLAAIVGTRHAKVLLKIANVTGGAATMTIRRNGDAANPLSGVQTSINFATGNVCYLICDTDIAGIIEWKSSVAAGTVEIAIMNWIAEP